MITRSVCGMPVQFITCSKVQNPADTNLIVGPEIYAGHRLLRQPFTGAGQLPFPGTSDNADFDNGMQFCRISAANAKPIMFNGCEVGAYMEDEHATYALLGGLHPLQTHASPHDQCLELFEQIQNILQSVGMSFTDVIRTWFFNDRILDWYADFNRARDTFFRNNGIFDRLVPASTGIGSANVWGAALMARILAVCPKSPVVRTVAVPSPLQCPALDYCSSFSRAVELQHPDYRHLIISGTASIEPGGKTAHVGDIDHQIHLTLDVVQAILQSRGMNWQDTLRAVIYLKETNFRTHYENIAAAREIPPLPAVCVQADVCRDDLLFEIELDAAIAS